MSKMSDLYDEQSRSIMSASDNGVNFFSNRIEQIRDFALTAGMERIGIANCVTFSYETGVIKDFLTRDFEVFTADCKYGRLSRKELLGRGSGPLCNPAGQADYLNSKNTDLNLSIGLCVGHDMVFNLKSEAPVTTIFTKDFSNNHDAARIVAGIERISV